MNNKIVHHLSHTDLDGYSCQLIMKYTPYTLFNYNANYGAEVKQKLEMILENIIKDDISATILITDLNLTADESKWLNSEVEKLIEKKKEITLTLLDHHGTGEESAKKYNWYMLDTNRCATKITYDFAKEHYALNEPLWMEKFVNIVNAVDLWKIEEHDNFEYGKVCMRLITETRELNKIMFADEDNEYKISLLLKSTKYIDNENAPIILDEKIHMLKKDFFKKDKDDTLDNLATEYIVKLLGNAKDEKTIYYKGYRGFLSYGLGNTSIIGNGFLLAYPEYDFIVDVSYRGTMSLRANNNVSVSQISKEWANGGGHPNAAGGRIAGFKEQFRYDMVKKQIEKIISEKEAVAGELEYKKES
ncbi:MAG: phosphoesterase [Sulfurimonas sp. RIFOXYD12_FULL_33_39]|uniref:DHH family phosphoesterase n=1 Tax=unclassified Sulfurimonas TaxID=2623549 RepID=UPI0008B253ED|nr:MULTISPECIES: phosphoesterase [unclassified Sulfurimonas]OHE03088.1 MAG: phosphoesterase [Sulfurimonas sp. RIFCSPLOWO2_12_FULL_34_6]OHE09032.1 MAG: phosphoesterase [Sulfurimonas sp. RIFOXYD12_FULL_33_39]OHE14342.1 MAG: phosphoesterase [Sulfurimonas sp. RIFOXYD2_FULL_34_21]